MKCNYYSNLGHYNYCSNEKDWVLHLNVKDGEISRAISTMFAEEDGDPAQGGGIPPSEVLEIIAKRIESYWISTGREKDRETIDWMRKRVAEMDSAWASQRIKCLHKEIKDLESYLLEAAKVA